jgi:hypothetical protein
VLLNETVYAIPRARQRMPPELGKHKVTTMRS